MVRARSEGALDIHPKVAAGGISGAVAVCITYALGYWIVIPPEVAAAGTVVLSTVAGYFAPWVSSRRPR